VFGNVTRTLWLSHPLSKAQLSLTAQSVVGVGPYPAWQSDFVRRDHRRAVSSGWVATALTRAGKGQMIAPTAPELR
jgi:hypothetical protein